MGVEAVGAMVARDFGEDGVFTGTVVAFSRGLYRIRYSDGDEEDMDEEEFNYAYAFHLEREGWEVEECDGGGGGDASEDDRDGWERGRGDVSDSDDDAEERTSKQKRPAKKAKTKDSRISDAADGVGKKALLAKNFRGCPKVQRLVFPEN